MSDLPEIAARRVYVIHGGLFSGRKNQTAGDIREALLKRGIPEQDVIVMKSCFPGCQEEHTTSDSQPAGIFSALCRWGRTAVTFARNCMTYLDAGLPDSRVSQESFASLKEALPQGERVNVTFIGYSGGGQVGLTMAHLADRDPKLNLDRVITLGSPIMWNNAPPRVAVTNYVSDGDWVLQGASCLPLVSEIAPSPDGNDSVLRFGGNVGHFQWASHPQVLDSLGHELRLPGQSPVRQPVPGLLQRWAY